MSKNSTFVEWQFTAASLLEAPSARRLICVGSAPEVSVGAMTAG